MISVSSNLNRQTMSFRDLEAGLPLNSTRGNTSGITQQDPAQSIASGIFQINTAVSTFQQLVNTLGTPRDTLELRENLHMTRLHIGQLVKDTSDKLKEAGKIYYGSEVRASKKIRNAKLAKDFEAVLREFQKSQLVASKKETVYTPFVPQVVFPVSYAASEMDISSDKNQEQRALLVDSSSQEVRLLENEYECNKAIIEETEQAMQGIQKELEDIHEIFKYLEVLVHNQGPLIDNISSNIVNSHVSVAEAVPLLEFSFETRKPNFFKSFFNTIKAVAVAVAVVAVSVVVVAITVLVLL